MDYPLRANRSSDRNASASAASVDVMTYAEIAAMVVEVRAFYAELSIHLNRDSALGALLRGAEQIAGKWAAGKDLGIRDAVNIGHARRIATAVLGARSDISAKECLRRMAKKDFHLSKRSSSQGKDALWELELLHTLRRRGAAARLEDPPDLIIDLGTDYPLACKKVYSERGVKAQLRKGLQQIRPLGQGAGLVAFNLDDLVPEDVVLQSRTVEGASDHLHKFNEQFVQRHLFDLQDAITQGKCDGFIFSTSVPSAIHSDTPQFNSQTETMLWSLTGARDETKQRIVQLRAVLGRPESGLP